MFAVFLPTFVEEVIIVDANPVEGNFTFPTLDEREFEEPKACVGDCMCRSISKCRPSR